MNHREYDEPFNTQFLSALISLSEGFLTSCSHPSLSFITAHKRHVSSPGTIYTAAEEIEAAGGKALPCVVDVRDEDAVGAAVESAVVKFGGLDILVNNASAIALQGTLEVDMKR